MAAVRLRFTYRCDTAGMWHLFLPEILRRNGRGQICGALTAVQLIKRSPPAGGRTVGPLRWWWVLAPAIITHGTYDSVLFILATLGANEPTPLPEPGGEGGHLAAETVSWAELAMLPLGWLYLLVPLW
eukprot:COSAG01_NODE_3983_length_5467_cov_3.221498_7_plen_128_part_00